MASLSEAVMRRYPEKRDEFMALRQCQVTAWKYGAVAFAISGLTIFMATRTYARKIDPTFHMYVPMATGVGATVASAATSWHIAQRELGALKLRRAQEAAAIQAAQGIQEPAKEMHESDSLGKLIKEY
eukprot:m.249107 g.249107  ORF g.249107 m.249107 type:complete len:128 (-) comp17508_c0_seq3:2242-2625(-)